MLLPKRVKYRRQHRGRMKGAAHKRQLRCLRRFRPAGFGAVLDHFQPDRGCSYRNDTLHQTWRSGMDQDLPTTNQSLKSQLKPEWVPVKVAPEYWVAVVKPGSVMFEIGGVSEELAREAMRLAMSQTANQVQICARKEEKEGEK